MAFSASILIFLFHLFQMHHPIQMKPADSENRNGEYKMFFFSAPIHSAALALKVWCADTGAQINPTNCRFSFPFSPPKALARTPSKCANEQTDPKQQARPLHLAFRVFFCAVGQEPSLERKASHSQSQMSRGKINYKDRRVHYTNFRNDMMDR